MPGGRKPINSIKKPNLLRAVNYIGGVTALSRMLKVSHSCISNWLYTDISVSDEKAKMIEKICKGKIRALDINKSKIFVPFPTCGLSNGEISVKLALYESPTVNYDEGIKNGIQ